MSKPGLQLEAPVLYQNSEIELQELMMQVGQQV
jgi:hypothetical protein